MIRRRILILDCTTNKKPKEGRFIESLLKTYELYKPTQLTSLRFKIKNKKDFVDKLNSTRKYDIIHISAFGYSEGIGNGDTWEINAEEIKKEKHPLRRAKIVHLSACDCNYKEMGSVFNSNYFIAPKINVEWIDAAMFSSLFYKNYLVDGFSLRNSFEYALKKIQKCTDYQVYWKE